MYSDVALNEVCFQMMFWMKCVCVCFLDDALEVSSVCADPLTVRRQSFPSAKLVCKDSIGCSLPIVS